MQHEFTLSVACVAHIQEIDKNVGYANFIILSVSASVTHMCITGSSGRWHIREVLDTFDPTSDCLLGRLIDGSIDWLQLDLNVPSVACWRLSALAQEWCHLKCNFPRTLLQLIFNSIAIAQACCCPYIACLQKHLADSQLLKINQIVGLAVQERPATTGSRGRPRKTGNPVSAPPSAQLAENSQCCAVRVHMATLENLYGVTSWPCSRNAFWTNPAIPNWGCCCNCLRCTVLLQTTQRNVFTW